MNSSFRVMCPIETNVLITLVPTLAPIITGIAPSIVRAPVATIPTVIDVIVEEI